MWPSAAPAPSAQVVLGSAAPAVARQPEPEATPNGSDIDRVRSAVLTAVAATGLGMLSTMLEAGVWEIEGSELTIRVAASPPLIEMSLSNEAKRSVMAAANAALGRTIRLQVVPGASPPRDAPNTFASGSSGSSRGRAEQEPVVRRMMEKFGAEIRTVIDYKGKA